MKPENFCEDGGKRRHRSKYHENGRTGNLNQLAKMMIFIFSFSKQPERCFHWEDRTSYQVRGSIENDVERLAMKNGDVPPPMLERAVNPRILKNQIITGISFELGQDAPCYL